LPNQQPRALVGRSWTDADEVVGGTLHAVRPGEDVGEVGVLRPVGRELHGKPERRVVDHEREVEHKALAAVALVRAPQRREPSALRRGADRDLAQPLRPDAGVPRGRRAANRGRLEPERLQRARQGFVAGHPISRAACRYHSARKGGT
jgi:hypothetical protein